MNVKQRVAKLEEQTRPSLLELLVDLLAKGEIVEADVRAAYPQWADEIVAKAGAQ